MSASDDLEYGKCPCGGQYENRSVEVRMTVHGTVITLSDVPQGTCPNCGSRIYKKQVIEYVESVMKGETAIGIA